MAAPYRAVEAIYKVVRKHVSDQQMEAIIDDLLQIPASLTTQSVRDTIKRLAGEDAKVKGGSSG